MSKMIKTAKATATAAARPSIATDNIDGLSDFLTLTCTGAAALFAIPYFALGRSNLGAVAAGRAAVGAEAAGAAETDGAVAGETCATGAAAAAGFGVSCAGAAGLESVFSGNAGGVCSSGI